MNCGRYYSAFGAGICVALLCSFGCSPKKGAENAIRATRPAETVINEGVLYGDPLFVTLNNDSVEKLLFMMDTGSTRTVLDKSLEPILGQRLGTGASRVRFGFQPLDEGIFKAPKLYLAGTQLVTGPEISTMDMHGTPRFPIMGVLGMDCLQSYCIQLNFEQCRMRFLDPYSLNLKELGQVFPMTVPSDGLKPMIYANLVGETNVPFVLDTGFANCGDIMLTPRLFERAFREQKPVNMDQMTTPGGEVIRVAVCQKLSVGDESYSDVVLWEIPLQSGEPDHGFIGLRACLKTAQGAAAKETLPG